MKQTNLFDCRGVHWGVAALLLFATTVANAYDFRVDGIFYNSLSSLDRTCEVTCRYYDSSSNADAYTDAVVIPETVTYLGTTYSVVAIGDYAFYYCSALTEVTIPESVTEIGSWAFQGCRGLIDVTIGNSVTTIRDGAFNYCVGLTQVTIPESVILIRDYAFSECTGLESVTALNPEPPTCNGTHVFENVDTRTCVLYVPLGATRAYSTATGWEDFFYIEEMEMDAIDDITANGNTKAVGYYTTDGKQVPSPQRGINIIRYSDGTAKKTIVK